MEHLNRTNNYSMAVWLIKPGREAEFVSTWHDFATWTSESGSGALEGILVQDVDEPRRFFCFWPFESEEGIRRWRSDTKFKEFMMRMRAYCESCQPSISRTVGHVDGSCISPGLARSSSEGEASISTPDGREGNR
jgi:heme-degrading monooxygenase HmoA